MSERAALEARWLELTRTVLPALAAERGWPVSADHCFQRIILDAIYRGVWYAHIEGRPAYRAMATADLARGVALAEQIASGQVALEPLNRASLAYRRSARRN